MAKIRVLVADDHAVLRAGLRLLINTQRDLEVIGETGDFMATRDAVGQLDPDVATIDLSMPGGHGIRLVEWLSREAPRTRLLVLSMHDDPAYVRMAFAAGAAGYVMKKSADTDLLEAIRTVAVGRSYLPRMNEEGPVHAPRSAPQHAVAGNAANLAANFAANPAAGTTAADATVPAPTPMSADLSAPSSSPMASSSPMRSSSPMASSSPMRSSSPMASTSPMASSSPSMGSTRETARNSFTELSERERQVLLLVARGYTNQAIANQLYLSVKTIESYRARLMSKLGLRNRAELTQFAMFVEPQAMRDDLPSGGSP